MSKLAIENGLKNKPHNKRPINEKEIQTELNKRKPGQSKFTTQRKEDDKVEILSGIFQGKTTGTPISLIIYNKDAKSRDYETIKNKFRPGHADYTYFLKYGIRDYTVSYTHLTLPTNREV